MENKPRHPIERGPVDNRFKMKYHPKSAANCVTKEASLQSPTLPDKFAPIFSSEQYQMLQRMMNKKQDTQTTTNVAGASGSST
ncbi:hypothetical protein HAX54_014833, partial [Datura stramonium]|nr:hypothetical protein [Datura stramonium]